MNLTRTAFGSWSGGRFMHFGEPLDDERFLALIRPDEFKVSPGGRLPLETVQPEYGALAPLAVSCAEYAASTVPTAGVPAMTGPGVIVTSPLPALAPVVMEVVPYEPSLFT